MGEGCGLELRIEKFEHWSTLDLTAIDNRVKRNSEEGLEILGAAIGKPSFVAASLRKRVNKIEKLLDNLAYLDDPHCALGILRSCLGAPKMVYSLRCSTPSDESSVILQDFDNLQRTTFDNYCCAGICLSPNEQGQCSFFPFNPILRVDDDKILKTRLWGFLRTNKRQILNCVDTMVICGHKVDRKKTF